MNLIKLSCHVKKNGSHVTLCPIYILVVKRKNKITPARLKISKLVILQSLVWNVLKYTKYNFAGLAELVEKAFYLYSIMNY